jgi:hypothetical protein
MGFKAIEPKKPENICGRVNRWIKFLKSKTHQTYTSLKNRLLLNSRYKEVQT